MDQFVHVKDEYYTVCSSNMVLGFTIGKNVEFSLFNGLDAVFLPFHQRKLYIFH